MGLIFVVVWFVAFFTNYLIPEETIERVVDFDLEKYRKNPDAFGNHQENVIKN